MRVHEELVAAGAELSYTALTAFCRRHGIGYAPPVPAGRYDFAPAEELQHDTSPHELELGGRKRKVQTASAVLCYSRMLFFQCYPTFRRFDCKVFLTEALRYFGGATGRVMIDNTHVVVLRGSGRDMVPAPARAAGWSHWCRLAWSPNPRWLRTQASASPFSAAALIASKPPMILNRTTSNEGQRFQTLSFFLLHPTALRRFRMRHPRDFGTSFRIIAPARNLHRPFRIGDKP